MQDYEVEITEVLKKTVIVQANNPKEAQEQAELEWDKGNFKLTNNNDFYSSNFISKSKRKLNKAKNFNQER